MKRLDSILQALILIKIGQDLGSNTRLAHSVHDFVEMFIAILK